MSHERLETIDTDQKKVLLWTNADKNGSGELKSLPSIELLLDRNACLIIPIDPGIAVQRELQEAITKAFADRIGEKPGMIQFYVSETADQNALADELAAMAPMLQVIDNLALCFDEKAAFIKLARNIPSYSGLTLEREKEALDAITGRGREKTAFILGGKNIEMTIQLLNKCLLYPDIIIIGGAVACTFLKSRAIPVGRSVVETAFTVPGFQILEKAALEEKEVLLPIDHIVAEEYTRKAKSKNVGLSAIPEGWMALDIGSKTVSTFEKVLKKCDRVFWHGSLGVTEIDQFARGSERILKTLSKSKAKVTLSGASIVDLAIARGHSFSALIRSGAIEYLSGKRPPGLLVTGKQE